MPNGVRAPPSAALLAMRSSRLPWNSSASGCSSSSTGRATCPGRLAPLRPIEQGSLLGANNPAHRPTVPSEPDSLAPLRIGDDIGEVVAGLSNGNGQALHLHAKSLSKF